MVGVRFFDYYEEIEPWIREHPEGVVVSDKTPLLANLSMTENIALIDQVHQNCSIKDSEKLARQLLEKLNLTAIEKSRVSICSDLELFATMLLRAERMPDDEVFIVLPLSLLGHADAIGQTLALMQLLDSHKKFSILELSSNRIHYQGQACHIFE